MGYNPKAQTMSDRPEHLAGAVCSWPADAVSLFIYEPIYLRTFKKFVYKYHWFGISLDDAIQLRKELNNAIHEATKQERNSLKVLRKDGAVDEIPTPGE